MEPLCKDDYMKMLTFKDSDGVVRSSADEKTILERLHYYEEKLYTLYGRREMTRQRLRQLQLEKREKTAQYKELLGDELVSDSVLSAFDIK